jgi:hypothetical protein
MCNDGGGGGSDGSSSISSGVDNNHIYCILLPSAYQTIRCHDQEQNLYLHCHEILSRGDSNLEFAEKTQNQSPYFILHQPVCYYYCFLHIPLCNALTYVSETFWNWSHMNGMLFPTFLKLGLHNFISSILKQRAHAWVSGEGGSFKITNMGLLRYIRSVFCTMAQAWPSSRHRRSWRRNTV